MNIYYIRAAIEAATGIKLTVHEVKTILLEENMISQSKADKAIFTGYSDFYATIGEGNSEKLIDLLGEEVEDEEYDEEEEQE